MNLLSTRSRHYHVSAFEQMVDEFNAMGVDHVVCTGDVTNLALRQEFEFARAKFDKLALGPHGVTVIPGNHDAYVAAGIPLFAEIFGDFATTDAGWAWTDADAGADEDPGVPHWPIVRVRGELAIIGLSTSRQTPWFTAYGKLGAGQLARLDRVLGDPRLAGKLRLVAVHHPPAGKRAHSKIRGLRDHAELAGVLAARGAELVIHGHEHRCMTEQLPGPEGRSIPVRGVCSGTYFHNKPDKTARFRIYELANGRVVADHVRVWDPAQGRFLEQTPAQLPREASVTPA